MSKHIMWSALALAVLLSQHASAQDRSFSAYQTTTAPKIDGQIDLGEWDAAGVPIYVDRDRPLSGFDNPIPEDPYGGADDLSYQFRAMWVEPFMLYMLVEINDDIAMDEDPKNLWERDQVELFFDGDDQHGNDVPESFQWWDNPEPFGKFGVSRYTTFEGNSGKMSDNADDIYADDDVNFIAAAAQAAETGVNANYFVEYAISFESMFLRGAFGDDSVTEAAGQLVADHTTVKAQIALSDDDNYEDLDIDTSRSSTLAFLGLSDWRMTTEFADMLFAGPYVAGGITGDFDGNGALEVADIDALTAAAAAGNNEAKYDLTGDSLVDANDITKWVHDEKKTWIGDANLDGLFNTTDLVVLFSAGTYEIDTPAVWSSGDFDGDGKFGTSDLVAALSDGGYEGGPRAAVSAVPEPTSATLMLLGVLPLLRRRK
ncbi:MAG: hypothetical protein KDA92_08840 [Planctomycetales bacterium]|nr:hypothetical protein [Planctomycetales bacterium]MCA9170519.1 hypothetical protein [Planctomycetales bacterium]